MSKAKLRVKGLLDYLGKLFHVSGKWVVVAFVLQIVNGFTQGIGLLLLIPLLNFIGILESSTGSSKIVYQLIELLQKTGIPPSLVGVLLIYVLIIGFNALVARYQAVLGAKVQYNFTHYLRKKLYESIGYAHWLYIVKTKLPDIAHVVTQEVQRAGQVTFQFLRWLSTFITIVTYLFVAFVLSAKMAGLALLGALFLILILKKRNRHAFNLGEASQFNNKMIYTTILEHLGGMKVAKSFAEEDKYIDELLHYSSELEKRRIDFSKLSSNTTLLFTIGAALILSVYVYLAVEVLSLPAATLLLLIFIFSRLLPKVSTLQSSFQMIYQLLPAFSLVVDFSKKSELNNENLDRTNLTDLKFENDIALENLSFAYDSKKIYESLNLEIQARSIVVLTGKSGTGKSTFIDLLLGLLKPQQGAVKVDGQLLDEKLLFSWRKNIAYVTQDTFLFNDTIANNIKWAKADADEPEIWEALKKASADEMVNDFEKGLDTMVGERGMQLSGGERQRIALARALIRKPQLLLLDEATSALDPENESIIIEALSKLKGELTILMITHKKQLLSIADKIYHLKKGKLEELDKVIH